MIVALQLIPKCHVTLDTPNTMKTSCKAILFEVMYPIAQEQSVWIINNSRSGKLINCFSEFSEVD